MITNKIYNIDIIIYRQKYIIDQIDLYFIKLNNQLVLIILPFYFIDKNKKKLLYLYNFY